MSKCNYLRVLSAVLAFTMCCARVRRLEEPLVTAPELQISWVAARIGDARVARRVGKASSCGGSVPGINKVSETGVRSNNNGDQKVALMYSLVPLAAWRNAAKTFSWVSFNGLGDIRSAALRLRASNHSLEDAVDGAGADPKALVEAQL